MRLHILVEGPSEEAFLRQWLPRFLKSDHSFKIIVHRGKGKLPVDPNQPMKPLQQGLLDQLPAKLRAYGHSLDSSTDRVLVLVDQDDSDGGDCRKFKARLVKLLRQIVPSPECLFRIAVEETEAFFLGDRQALKEAFKPKLQLLDDYEQDSICGTWELFQRVIKATSEDKPAWAEKMGRVMTTEYEGKHANQSPSFQHFCRGLLFLAGEIQDRAPQKRRVSRPRKKAAARSKSR